MTQATEAGLAPGIHEERRRRNRERSAKWRKAHPEKAREKARKASAKWRAEHHEEALAGDVAYRSAHPDRVKASNAASYVAHREERRAYAKAYRIEHLDKCRESQATYRAANLDKIRAYQAAYSKRDTSVLRNREKVKRHNALKRQTRDIDPELVLTPRQWARILSLSRGRCYWCRRKMKKPTRDHVIPLSKGGLHTASNIVAACLSCNCRKRDRIITLL